MTSNSTGPEATNWSAVFSLTLCVAGLITAELLPASLLTPMASDLGVSEGLTGQSVTATAVVAMIASVFVAPLTRGLDRRHLMLALAALTTVSNLLVALSPNFTILMAGRLLLGVSLGGFWSMAASLSMRLSRPSDVPKALSTIFGGVSVAMVIAAPLGSLLGGMLGWRGVFGLAVVLATICLIWLAAALPKMPSVTISRVSDSFGLLKRPGVVPAMLANFTVFAGQFAFFTYMRPFFEQSLGFGLSAISAVFLLFGIANFIGTSMSSVFLNRSLKVSLAAAPLVMAACALIMMLGTGHDYVAAFVTAVWGFAFGIVPVGWSTWVTRSLGDQAENAGGLQVAVIQFANTAGAGIGGLVLDMFGANGPVATAAILLAITSVIVATYVSTRPHVSRDAVATA